MVAAAGDAAKAGVAERLGIKPGMVVQELGWDSDVDESVRAAIEDPLVVRRGGDYPERRGRIG